MWEPQNTFWFQSNINLKYKVTAVTLAFWPLLCWQSPTSTAPPLRPATDSTHAHCMSRGAFPFVWPRGHGHAYLPVPTPPGLVVAGYAYVWYVMGFYP